MKTLWHNSTDEEIIAAADEYQRRRGQRYPRVTLYLMRVSRHDYGRATVDYSTDPPKIYREQILPL
jgi:hypothetical protein